MKCEGDVHVSDLAVRMNGSNGTKAMVRFGENIISQGPKSNTIE
jgi:hypothetical protein